MIAKERCSSDSYYQKSAFNQLIPVALFYSAVTNFGLLLAKPFLPRRSLQAPLRPQDTLRTSGGEVAIVTGANAGIGFETAAALVERGYDVVLACRSRDKGERAAEQLNDQSNYPSGCQYGKAIFLHPLDLSSFGSVRDFAAAFKSKYSTCNILVNNAGINNTGESVDGFDLCFQTNFMGHFLLTRLLLPCLLKAKNQALDGGKEAGRVVNLSSVTHHFVRADEPRNEGKGENGRTRNHDEAFWRGCAAVGVSNNTYRESKLASILFTLMLKEKYSKDGLKAVTANPGSVNSDIWRNYPKFLLKYILRPLFKLVYLTSRQGSRTSVAAAVGSVPNGVYLQPYWQPRKSSVGQYPPSVSFGISYGLPFPAFEMLGTFVGHAITEARLPDDGKDGFVSASAMWKVCSEIVDLP